MVVFEVFIEADLDELWLRFVGDYGMAVVISSFKERLLRCHGRTARPRLAAHPYALAVVIVVVIIVVHFYLSWYCRISIIKLDYILFANKYATFLNMK